MSVYLFITLHQHDVLSAFMVKADMKTRVQFSSKQKQENTRPSVGKVPDRKQGLAHP